MSGRKELYIEYNNAQCELRYYSFYSVKLCQAVYYFLRNVDVLKFDIF